MGNFWIQHYRADVKIQINQDARLKKNDRIIRLTFLNKKIIIYTINKGPFLIGGRFRSEGKIHLSQRQPAVWNYENFLKGECHYG